MAGGIAGTARHGSKQAGWAGKAALRAWLGEILTMAKDGVVQKAKPPSGGLVSPKLKVFAPETTDGSSSSSSAPK